jgi:hypothetical protein
VELTAAERVLLHLHGFWNAREPTREMTQAGIAEGARVLRSHVPRALRTLESQTLVQVEEAHVRGSPRKVRVYRLTDGGIRYAREVLSSVDAMAVAIDGRRTTIGEARRILGVAPLTALFSVDAEGRLDIPAVPSEGPELLHRGPDLAFLRRWLAGPAGVAVVYGARGMGKTSLARAFVRSLPKHAWIDLEGVGSAASLARSVARTTGIRAAVPDAPSSVADAIVEAARSGRRPVVFDSYGEIPEDLVDVFASCARAIAGVPEGKVLVLAQESTPAYCRFYDRDAVDRRRVAERHLSGLDLDGCREMLGNPRIEEDALRRIYLLTKGCPLYLRCIRDGDAAGLKAASRFTAAEIRLLLYSGRARVPTPPAS